MIAGSLPPLSWITPCETDWVSGRFNDHPAQVLDDVGVLDDGYYTYFDDIDYCFNARKHGWPTWYVPSSRVVHLVGQTTGVKISQPKRVPSYVLDARRRYLLKNHGPLYAALVDAGMIVGLSLNRLRALLTGKADNTAPHRLPDAIRHSVFLKGFSLRTSKTRLFECLGLSIAPERSICPQTDSSRCSHAWLILRD